MAGADGGDGCDGGSARADHHRARQDVLGPNGAGKTTTVECVEGLRSPDGGQISVLGLDPQRDQAQLCQVLGVQLQSGELPEKLRVAEAVDLYASFHPSPADPGELIDRWGLGPKRNTAFGDLSGGQKQRLWISLALVGNPRVPSSTS